MNKREATKEARRIFVTLAGFHSHAWRVRYLATVLQLHIARGERQGMRRAFERLRGARHGR